MAVLVRRSGSTSRPQNATENFAYFDTDGCFIGHTHNAMYALFPEGAQVAEVYAWRRIRNWICSPGAI